MTFNEVINQIYALASGDIDGAFMPRQFFGRYVQNMFRDNAVRAFVITVTLPDGVWLCEIERWEEGGYWYNLPETREQESRLAEKYGITRTATGYEF